MRRTGTTAWRLITALAVVTLAAGIVGGLWGARARGTPASEAPTTPAAVASPPVSSGPVPGSGETGSPTDRAQAAVGAAVASLAAGRPAGSMSVAALDTTTGIRVGSTPDGVMTAASVFKLLLLEAYLLLDQDRGLPPGEDAATALTPMIENSDNDAADRVFALLGGADGVASAVRRLGLSATALGPRDQWGLSTTSATDQLTALTDLVSPHSPLSSSSRAYALGLMSDVESDQRWGVGAASDPGTPFANKNGWLDVDDDDGRWAVNSVGVLQVGGHQVLLAVLTQHDSDLADGTALVESLSRDVATALVGSTAQSGSATRTPGH